MKIVLLLIFLLFLAFDCLACESVKIEIGRQRSVAGLTDTHQELREIEFRVTNTSKCKVFVKGFQGKSFFPIGFTSKFDKGKRQWDSYFGYNVIPEIEDLGIPAPDSYLLIPNESFTFYDLLEPSWVKSRYKRILYMSFESENAYPAIVVSPVFTDIGL